MSQSYKSSSNAVYSLKLHIVFVTKYRRKTLTPALLSFLGDAFDKILSDWNCTLIEFGGEADHVHLLVDIHPALDISVLMNNLKTASARRANSVFAEHLAGFYGKPTFWHRAYFVASVGSTSLDTIKKYVEQQGTKEKPRKSASS